MGARLMPSIAGLRILAVGFVAVVGFGCPAVAVAEPSAQPQDTWVTNGGVTSIVREANTVYLAGTFTSVGPQLGQGVAISTLSAKAVAGFPEVSGGNGRVNAVLGDGSGGWFIGGSFDFVGAGNVRRPDLAHIRADGSVDPTFDPAVAGFGSGFGVEGVDALALSPDGHTLYVGGYFTSLGGVSDIDVGAVYADSSGGHTPGANTGWSPKLGCAAGTGECYVDALAVTTSAV